jgi:hypothetical protein
MEQQHAQHAMQVHIPRLGAGLAQNALPAKPRKQASHVNSVKQAKSQLLEQLCVKTVRQEALLLLKISNAQSVTKMRTLEQELARALYVTLVNMPRIQQAPHALHVGQASIGL